MSACVSAAICSFFWLLRSDTLRTIAGTKEIPVTATSIHKVPDKPVETPSEPVIQKFRAPPVWAANTKPVIYNDSRYGADELEKIRLAALTFSPLVIPKEHTTPIKL